MANMETINSRHPRLARPFWRDHPVQAALVLLVVTGALTLVLGYATGRIHTDFSIWNKLPWAVRIHASSAIFAFFLGGAQLVLPKRRKLHIVMGVTWVIAMISTATSAMFIQEIIPDHFSPIHLFVLLTVVGLYRGLMPLFRRRYRPHGKNMRGLYFGALVLAGLFTFLPGRVMYQMFTGS